MTRPGVRRARAGRAGRGGRRADAAGWTKLTRSELRAAQTEILSAFADFCVTNQLRYFLYAGTLLGSVRHEGYIPWDDDIDVVMPRRDYDRLHLIASQQQAINGFSLCSPMTAPGFPFPFAKVADNKGTLSVEDDDVDYRIGINIDVFPLDGWPAGILSRWVHGKSLSLLRALMYLHHMTPEFTRADLRESLLALAKPVAKLISLDWLIRRASSRASRYPAEESTHVGVVVWGYPERAGAQAYSGADELCFEKRRYRVPSGYEAVLTAKYGNYMRLPPPELRVPPHAIEAFRLG